MDTALDYANVTGRPTSRFLRALSTVSRSVASVQGQHAPYAREWHEANQVALSSALNGSRRWIVFGDSMSQAIGASTARSGWVDQLHARLVRAGHDLTIVNLSASGARVADVLSQQVPAWRSLPAADVPDLLTVLIGSNDLMRSSNRARLPEAFRQLLVELPAGAVVASLPQPRAAAAAANAYLLAAEARGDLTVVDMRRYGPRSWRGLLASDKFHPNDAGYAAIADAFDPFVRAALA